MTIARVRPTASMEKLKATSPHEDAKPRANLWQRDGDTQIGIVCINSLRYADGQLARLQRVPR